MRLHSFKWLLGCIIITSVTLLYLTNIWYRGRSFTMSNASPLLSSTVKSQNCKWPPTNISNIENNGTYDVTICIQLTENGISNDKPKRYRLNDIFKVQRTITTISFEEIPYLPPRILNTMKYPRVYDTYPQDVPIKTIIGQIKAGLPVSYEPKYNYPIKILRTSSSVCSGVTRHDLVVVVKSGIYNFEGRDEFRSFMKNQIVSRPSFKVGYVFSVGLPRSHGGRFFNRDGNIMNLPGCAGDLLEKYDGKSSFLMDKLHKEMDKYDDIILGDYEDTYLNLTWKTVTNLRWISAFCDKNHGDFFMTMDDDHRMNLSLVENFTKGLSSLELRKSIYGRVNRKDRVFRNKSSKNFMSYPEMPWDILAPHPKGMSQFIGADIVDDMAIATGYTKFDFLSEDVYIGLLAQKLAITLRNVLNMFNHGEYEKYSKTKPALVAWKKYF